MFNLIYHFLPKNHKWNRCSSGRVSVDSAAFFGYKFGYKILNSRKPSGSAGAKQLTNNLRMDAMDGSDGRNGRFGCAFLRAPYGASVWLAIFDWMFPPDGSGYPGGRGFGEIYRGYRNTIYFCPEKFWDFGK